MVWSTIGACTSTATTTAPPMGTFEESTADNLTAYPSYMNKYGSDPRTSSVTVTTDAPLNGAAITTIVDGDYLGSSAKPWFAADATGNRQITFQFPVAVKITEAKFFMTSPSAQGTWKWQASSNGSSWADIYDHVDIDTLTGDFRRSGLRSSNGRAWTP